jgi:CO/xanthine dehydrogenase FAD-binding subunit
MIYTPSSLDEALVLLAEKKRRPLAGATDYMVARSRGKAGTEDLVSLDLLEELKKIEVLKEGVSIGSMVTFSRLEHEEAAPSCLREAASLVGGPQIRNRGTIGGNIAGASPAADSVPALAVMDASLFLKSKAGAREVPLESFIPGPGRTALESGELLTGILLPPRPGLSAFFKLGKRNALSISVINMAVRLFLETSGPARGRIADIAIAAGSAAPRVVRARDAEKFLRGSFPDAAVLGQAACIMAGELSPISDIRAGAQYRLEAAKSVFINLTASLAAAPPARGA